MQSDNRLISVVVPMYNEEAVLPEFYRRLNAVLGKHAINAEIVFVNDGSVDGSISWVDSVRADDSRVTLIDLSRNFGKEVAMTAGLDYAKGDAVIVIDADLQDPPELIPDLIKGWDNGYDVVYATRVSRAGESWLKKSSAHLFYRLMKYVGRVPIPQDTGDYRLLSRRAVDALGKLRERSRFMKGLFSWIGFAQTSVVYERDARFSGESKWGYWKLWNFALEGIVSFTTMPLKVASYFGIAVSMGAFVYGSWIILKTLIFGEDVPGYPSLMVAVLFLGGVQLIALGVIGEYMGRIFEESKGRPLYIINRYEPSVDNHAGKNDVMNISADVSTDADKNNNQE